MQTLHLGHIELALIGQWLVVVIAILGAITYATWTWVPAARRSVARRVLNLQSRLERSGDSAAGRWEAWMRNALQPVAGGCENACSRCGQCAPPPPASHASTVKLIRIHQASDSPGAGSGGGSPQ